MANFPPSPSLGELFTINNMTYRFNESGAWEVVITQSDESLVDVGVSTFVSESSSPSAVAGKALLYAKGVAPPFGGLGDACFHLDDNTDDAVVGGTGATWQGSPYTGTQYATSTAGSGFGKMGRISNNPANNLDDNALSIPNPGIGTGPFTLEFWMDFATSGTPTSTYQYWLSCGTTTANEFELYYHPSSNADKLVFISRQTSIGSATIVFNVVIGDNVPAHYALVRGADSGGNSTWALYVNGTAATISSGSATIKTQDITDPLVIGRYVPTNPYGIKDGGVDEVRVSKSAVYSSNFTKPAEPFPFSNISKLHVMDSTGSEGVIS